MSVLVILMIMLNKAFVARNPDFVACERQVFLCQGSYIKWRLRPHKLCHIVIMCILFFLRKKYCAECIKKLILKRYICWFLGMYVSITCTIAYCLTNFWSMVAQW